MTRSKLGTSSDSVYRSNSRPWSPSRNTNGMIVGKFGNVTGNLAGDNTGDGIHVGSGSQVNGNTATENTVGIWVECPSMVTRNESWNNTTNYSNLTGCRASGNQ